MALEQPPAANVSPELSHLNCHIWLAALGHSEDGKGLDLRHLTKSEPSRWSGPGMPL